MATPAELQAILDRRYLELRALRTKANDLPDGPERDAIQAQRAALSAEQKTTTRELEVATSQGPATGQFDGIDRNSGQYRYINPVTGTAFLSPTAPSSAQQQQSGQTVPTPAATPLSTEAQPETAPAEVQTPANTPQFVETIEPAPVRETDTTFTDTRPPIAAPIDVDEGNNSVAGPGPGIEFVQNDAPAPVDTPLLTPEQSIARAQGVRLDVPTDDPAAAAADFNANTNTSVLGAIGVPPPVDPTVDKGNGSSYNPSNAGTPGSNSFAAGAGTFEGGEAAYTAQRAREQAAIQAQFQSPADGDWRVRLRLAPSATYLYKDSNNALLAPLATSNGVVFPYMPSISTSYNADYSDTALTHSNYKGYFYNSSYVGDVSITGIFTAQDTREANYMLAVIHFFRSVTKMFYGQDAQRGSPPPLVYLIGLGNYQFNNHPCVVKSFNYSLPNDVDYIRTKPNNYNLNFNQNLNKTQASPSPGIGSVLSRILNSGLKKGALPGTGSQELVVQQSVTNIANSTYVPTRIEIQLTLMPIQTRSQQSQQFSVKDYSSGKLLAGGFW